MVLSRARGIRIKRTLEIVPDVYQLTIRGTNIILLAEEELTLIDTGLPGSSAHIVDFIQSLGRSVAEISLIIITHNHFDHAGGLAELKKLTRAKVVAHQADFSDPESQLSYPRLIRKLLRIPPFSTLRSVFSAKPSQIDIQLTGGEILKPLGGLNVVHTPGHTPGSISLFSPANKLLMVADAINKHGKILRLPPKIASTDLTQAMDSIEMMSRLDFNVVCFGHGRPLTEDVHTRMQDLIKRSRY